MADREIHPRRPPDVRALLEVLVRERVEIVLIGSVALMAHGIELEPGDLDVVPRTDAANLARLCAVLAQIEAVPGGFGHWEVREDNGKKRWVQDDDSVEARLAWRGDVNDPSSFDHLFSSALGNFDVVPELAGTYDELMGTAENRQVCGFGLRVAHVDHLVRALEASANRKHAQRLVLLRTAMASRADESTPDF